MNLETILAETRALTLNVGKGAMNALFPHEFEYYMLGLELVNSKGETEEYFAFPVMPQSISQPKQFINNVQVTAGGIVSTSRRGFVPMDISISGDFGRSFKFLVREKDVIANAFSFIKPPSVSRQTFNSNIKTGYGCTKVLEALLEKANTLDANEKPYALFFYNPILGHNFLVKPQSFTIKQSMDKNMIHQYELTLEAIAPLEALVEQHTKGRVGAAKRLAYAQIQGRVAKLLGKVTGMVTQAAKDSLY